MRREWFSRRGYAESLWVVECNRASEEAYSRMPQEPHLLYALIVVCEAGFWVVLLLALAVRYDFKLWGRCIVACVITMALVEALVQFVGTREATQPLLEGIPAGRFTPGGRLLP